MSVRATGCLASALNSGFYVCVFVFVNVFVCLLPTDILLQAIGEVRRVVLTGGSRGSLHTID